MLTDEAFQMLLFDLFCIWHDVIRHYDPPITHTEDEKTAKVKKLICKLLGEIDARVKRIRSTPPSEEQEFIEEWTMLTWNVMCITSRLQNDLPSTVSSSEDRVIFNKLNVSLIELVNHSRSTDVPPTLKLPGDTLTQLQLKLSGTMGFLHKLYRSLKDAPQMNAEEIDNFDMKLNYFSNQILVPFIDYFKAFCNEQTVQLWSDVRAAQVHRMRNYQPMPHEPVNRLVSFYSYMMHKLAVLSARLQGFRFELITNKIFGDSDPVKQLSETVFSAVELLMSDCVLSTEPATNAILVTNNLFAMNCGALARGVVFKQFDVQIVTEEAAEHIQSEMRRQKMLQQPSPIGTVPSAALLAMKQTSGTKRSNSTTTSGGTGEQISDTQNNSTHKKSDVNSKETVTIYPVFNTKNRYWAATYSQLLVTTRQKGRQSTHSSFQDLSPNAIMDARSGKRPIFYFHVVATMFSPSGKFADAHTLSLPITIATRRNQDCQVQRMMSSYTATCFWLYGTNVQDGLMLQWCETGMPFVNFRELFKQHFRVHADVQRSLQDRDFELLQYKLQCNDCVSSSTDTRVNHCARTVSYSNMLCPHLRYECGTTSVRFSVWRGLLELLQIFVDHKTSVRKLWEKNLVVGFLEFNKVAAILAQYESALMMRLSFVTGGTICITVKSKVHIIQSSEVAMAPVEHLEPLDLRRLQGKCLSDYLRDIAAAEKVKYIIDGDLRPLLISDVIDELDDKNEQTEALETSREIASNVTHIDDIDSMQHVSFTAMRIAVVTCKVKRPPSVDMVADLTASAAGIKMASPVSGHYSNSLANSIHAPPALNAVARQLKPIAAATHATMFAPPPPMRLASNVIADDFVRELIQLCNFHGKSRQELISLLDVLPPELFCTLTPTMSSSLNAQHVNQFSPSFNSHVYTPSQPPSAANTGSYGNLSTPSPMNTSPADSTTYLYQPSSSLTGSTLPPSVTASNGSNANEQSPSPNPYLMSYDQ